MDAAAVPPSATSIPVENETSRWYAYIDMTPQAEALYKFIERTIDSQPKAAPQPAY